MKSSTCCCRITTQFALLIIGKFKKVSLHKINQILNCCHLDIQVGSPYVWNREESLSELDLEINHAEINRTNQLKSDDLFRTVSRKGIRRL